MSHASRTVIAATLVGSAIVAATAHGQQFQDQTSTHFPQPNLTEYTNQLSICDIDNDGDLDIAWANGQGYSSQGAALKVRIFINDGTGVFTDETDARTGGLAGWFRGVEFGDCDRDGDWDMILAQDFNKQPKLLINNGSGFFADESATRLPAATISCARAQFGDIDNDGDLDLVLCNSGSVNRFGTGQPKLYINDGTGHYTDATATNLPALVIADQQDVILGDVDGDLDLDIDFGSRASASKLYLNNGAGVFTNLAGFPGGATAYSYDFGDINGDGDLDLLGVNAGPSSTELLLQNNAPSMTWTNISSQISPNTSIDDNDSKFFDFDNDGDLDLIIGSLGASERIYRNNGSGASPQFTQVSGAITAIADSTLDVKVADVTGDGKLDVITAQGESGSFVNRIYVNIGPASVVDTIPPKIVQLEQVANSTTTGPFIIRTEAADGVTSDRGFYDKGVTLHYSLDGGADQTVPMWWSGNSLWRGTMPAQKSGGTVQYYVTATDFANNVGTSITKSFTITLPCLADATGDGSVNTADLLLVINNWGAAGGPADVAPPGGDGIVNTADLLAIINAWGPCQ